MTLTEQMKKERQRVREVERLEAKIAELRQEIEKAETRLGLTAKERVKRALLKYWLPTALAVGVAAVVGVIINMLKGTGNRIKKMGQVLKELGKKMAGTIPWTRRVCHILNFEDRR